MEYRSGGTGGPHPGVDIFPDLSPRAKPYCGGKVQPGVALPCHSFYLEANQQIHIPGTYRRNETYASITP